MLIKLGESVCIRPEDIRPVEKLVSDSDLDIENRMYRFAQELKVIAPKAKDFLYFTAVMMHAAEAACVNDDGSPKKTASGEVVSATWEKVGEGVKWVCNDPNIKCYRNNNRDIFPEYELKLAYKKWIGRPLCLDHQSQSVDKIRGVIVDTVYDDRRKRVIALCALDSKNYSDLADKVTSGVANNVSMGTGVGRAVCSECQRAARTEKDFCQHMKNKSCYGEINLELSPLELSLVVAGADPKAKVKHIIASDIAKAAELLSDYLHVKEAVSRQDLTSIQEDLKSLMGKIEAMAHDSDKKDESDAVGPTRSRWSMDEVSNEPSTQFNVPEAFPTYASELQMAILGAQTKLASLQDNILRLSNNSNEESIMTTKEAYFQGTEEPKPGQKQYAVDPLNEKARLLDKNLHGPAPFPNTGSVDGMYPGDDKTKKDLQRLADEHERAMFREAALKKAKEQLKQGYFQGTEEPTPGKPQYTKDPLNEKDRLLDKTMVGEKPFPGVGKVDGLYGDDLAEKEKLSRASLKARFEKVALPDGRINKGASNWVVLANGKPILQASVAQITRGNEEHLYDAIATERFGRSLLNRIQTEGFEATANDLLKTAQAPAAPPPAPEAAPAGDMPPLEPPKDVASEGGEPGEIVDDIQSLVDEMEGKISDLKDKVSGPVSEDAEGLGDVPPAGDEEFAVPAGGAPAPKSASQLQSMRKRVNVMLQDGIDETITSLSKHVNELKTAQKVYKESYASMTEEQRDYINDLTISAVKDAKAQLNDTNRLMEAVVKYATGTAGVEKRAHEEGLNTDELLDEIEGGKGGDDTYLDNAAFEDESPEATPETGKMKDFLSELGIDSEKDNDADMDGTLANGTPISINDKGEALLGKSTGGAKLELSTKQARAEARVKLAEKGLLGFNELSNDAHPGGSVDAVSAGNLDVKPSVPGSAFHVAKDIKDAMTELANMPPRVRKQAEVINELVSSGKMSAESVDGLVAHGIDPDAVKYWKELYGQGDSQSKEFATELTKEHANAKKAEEMEQYKGKLKRAYQVAQQMIVKGMISENQLDSQVEDIMNWNDAGFESIKNILSRQASISKQASLPVVGLLDSGSVILPAAQSATQESIDIKGLFDNHFASRKF
jgi:hypothetical protein